MEKNSGVGRLRCQTVAGCLTSGGFWKRPTSRHSRGSLTSIPKSVKNKPNRAVRRVKAPARGVVGRRRWKYSTKTTDASDRHLVPRPTTGHAMIGDLGHASGQGRYIGKTIQHQMFTRPSASAAARKNTKRMFPKPETQCAQPRCLEAIAVLRRRLASGEVNLRSAGWLQTPCSIATAGDYARPREPSIFNPWSGRHRTPIPSHPPEIFHYELTGNGHYANGDSGTKGPTKTTSRVGASVSHRTSQRRS